MSGVWETHSRSVVACASKHQPILGGKWDWKTLWKLIAFVAHRRRTVEMHNVMQTALFCDTICRRAHGCLFFLLSSSDFILCNCWHVRHINDDVDDDYVCWLDFIGVGAIRLMHYYVTLGTRFLLSQFNRQYDVTISSDENLFKVLRHCIVDIFSNGNFVHCVAVLPSANDVEFHNFMILSIAHNKWYTQVQCTKPNWFEWQHQTMATTNE